MFARGKPGGGRMAAVHRAILFSHPAFERHGVVIEGKLKRTLNLQELQSLLEKNGVPVTEFDCRKLGRKDVAKIITREALR